MKDMYTLPRDTVINNEVLNDVIRYVDKQKRRYDMLDRYYNGEHSILQRDKTIANSNNKLVVNHAKYITDITTGYFMGKPVDYVPSEGLDIEPLIDAYKNQVINDLDAEISENVSIYGKQYEYVYSNENAEPKSCIADCRNTIIVYDDTVEHKKLFGLMYRPIYIGDKRTVDHYEIIYCDKDKIVNYISNDKSLSQVGEEIPHTFGEVPMVEYKNNPRNQGDFECVITLIDAYNILQSDRVNDKEQLVDAILCMYGTDFDEEQAEKLRRYRMLASIPSDAKIEYLTKTLDESQVDVLRQNLENDIFKISATPNMTDKEFAQNSSGVAMKYKLLPFEERIGKKERYMEKGLLERFELYNNFLASKSQMVEVPTKEVDVVFTRNLPNNDFETSQMINNLSDLLPTETLIGQLSFVKDASEEVELKAKEDEAKPKDIYSTVFANTIPDANEEEIEEPENTEE